jgi:serine phosphatase RsbU (regulator of sigma subunit)
VNSPSRAALIRNWLTTTFSGRALLFGAAVKSIAALLRLVLPASRIVEAVDTVGDIALVTAALVIGYRLFVDMKRVVLWRVRRKLTLSYIFIGVVPALLIITFFLLSGLLLFFNVSAYALRTRVASLLDQAQFLAESAAVEVARAQGDDGIQRVLTRRHDGAVMRYPLVSYATVPAAKPCDQRPVPPTFAAGPWQHLSVPPAIPEWIGCDDFFGLIAYSDGPTTRLVARAVAWTPGLASYAVVVDIPHDEMLRQLGADAGIVPGQLATTDEIDAAPGDGPLAKPRVMAGPMNLPTPGRRQQQATSLTGLTWVAILEDVNWMTGVRGKVVMSFRMLPSAVYDKISGPAFDRLGNFSLGQILLILMGTVAALFLIIQLVAFGMGLALARSITGAVHELFVGTERVGRGDFTHKIPIRSRDQLGELAASFNSMTTSIEYLLVEKAEKERLEQELRIARAIQMSLLPQGPLQMPGLLLTPHCEPAREVGGDYYDYLPIDDHRIGLLIADVSGKGTSAALYMAELKGIMLSLSQRYTSPRELLISANQIISRHLDTRSFITITYAVVDMQARTLTYARAGHCPMIYVPGPYAARRGAEILLPDGMVLGLQLDEGQMFERFLEEATMPLGAGDLFLFYTDGITEAMNADGECFGDARLAAIVERHADLPAPELRERILRDVQAFAGTAAQQDDMTMLLLCVEDAGVVAR